MKEDGFFKKLRGLPRNVWAVSLTSFFMDISSEMVINILPLFLSNVFGSQDEHHRGDRRRCGINSQHPEGVFGMAFG